MSKCNRSNYSNQYNKLGKTNYSSKSNKTNHSSKSNKTNNSKKPNHPKKTNTSSKDAYVYSLNLQGGKKYVGLTQNPSKRISDHYNGKGAQWTQKNQPVPVNHIQKCKNLANAKKAETIVYYKMKNYHGISNVRGAGYTKSY